ncbi:MAG: two-component sensor histidine kinase [Rhodobacteraceae bacterium]|nr:two-component sensor histidine kinase [Paracoccaceae bacterium]MAY47528.1 two-component sensor histidine kinase [Paracoccaceae bacterium]QEW20187.1 Sensor protein kinase WalK [Marinibacterium anthonyi]
MVAIEQNDNDPATIARVRTLEKQLRDYVTITRKLVWQRQAIFLAATLLTASYYDAAIAFTTYAAVVATEVVDHILAYRVDAWRPDGADPKRARRFLYWVLANTLLSALAISTFVFSVSLQQPVGEHFTPLFFLFAAALFAAMNNHQVVQSLILRLVIYGATFMGIALLDIIRVKPSLDSVLWLHFFTTLFVLYFIIDCSYVFLQLYRANLNHLEKLTQEHKRTKAAYKVKSEFVSTVSHELRTPLTSIKGSLDLINSGMLGKVPEKMEPILAIAGRNSGRLAALINDILDLQKIESGEMNYRYELLDVHALLSEAIASNQGFAESFGVILEDPPEMGETLLVRGDEVRLMQVLTNILSNAVKFSNEGERVRVGYKRLGNRVRISVQDVGVGIPEGAHEKVFDKFTQLDSSDQRKVGGTGLGMSISKQIVEHHGGTIDYISTVGQGTTFFVDLDLV